MSFVIFAGFLFAVQPADELQSIPSFTKHDRVLILAPHPDDETIGAGGAIQKALKASADVYVVLFTNGDANQLSFIAYEKRLTFFKGEFLHMGRVRRKETLSAMESLGVARKKIYFLGYPDFGTMRIMLKHWGQVKPYRSTFTKVSNVPYEDNLSPGAAYTGENILKDIKAILLDVKPTRIFVSHPADTNADHQSLYLFLQVALWDLEGKFKRPAVYPYLMHYIGWPKPAGLHPQKPLSPPKDFASCKWLKLDLTQQETEKKRQALKFYKSQIPYNPRFLNTFIRQNELFADHLSLSPPSCISYEKKDGKLYIKLLYNRKITKGVTSFIYLLGYSKKTAFSQMPKIRLLITRTKLLVYNKKSRIFVNEARMFVKDDSITIEFPIIALNSPTFLLARARMHTNSVPLASSSWHILRLE